MPIQEKFFTVLKSISLVKDAVPNVSREGANPLFEEVAIGIKFAICSRKVETSMEANWWPVAESVNVILSVSFKSLTMLKSLESKSAILYLGCGLPRLIN